MIRLMSVLLIGGVAWCSSLRAEEWRPAKGPLTTKWTEQVSPQSAWPQYPRPQLVREQWTNLNGLWDYAIRPRDEAQPPTFDGQILVPYPVESALSGVMKKVGVENKIWYRTRFPVPALNDNQRLLLHFDAVDWHATVWLNGRKLGEHKGGYDRFSFDATEALDRTGDQELVVSVWDPTDKGFQPRGKQVTDPRGIWYTSVTGIWQTVWLETLAAAHIKSLHIVPDVDQSRVHVTADVSPAGSGKNVQVEVKDGDQTVVRGEGRVGETIPLTISNAKLWTPDSPFLYDLVVSLGDERPEDSVRSYFGMRKIALGKDKAGHQRLFLNNKPLFQFGPLDQGWWPDGLYTAPTDEALRYDVEVTKKLGMNMCRKHVKVEPDRWYYWCDKLGLMVWQDMPNGDKHVGKNGPDIERSDESAANFRQELKAMIDRHHNHPSIVVWVPFNEGWGQFDTKDVLAWVQEYDRSRLVDGPSGWQDRGSGDLLDIHRYPGPAMPVLEPNRAVVLGEFGGLGWPVPEHLWWDKRNWGYRTYKSQSELRTHYLELMDKLEPMIGRGLAAAVYTQTTDVEGEVNGLMTYDRKVIKLDADEVAAIHKRFYLPPRIVKTAVLVPTSESVGQVWRYTAKKPAEGWQMPDFDDSEWTEGKGGFGREDTPGAHVRTRWTGSDIWMRRNFRLDSKDLDGLRLRVHHDEDCEIFINGVPAASLEGYATEYEAVRLSEKSLGALRAGDNLLSLHCRQTMGGQYVDVGIVQQIEVKDR